MGVFKFQLTAPDHEARTSELRKAFVTGLDRTPTRLSVEFRPGLMLCHRDPRTLTGRIVAQTYHGGHVDLQIACRACGDGLLLLRSAGDQAMTSFPPGAEVGISIDTEGWAHAPLATPSIINPSHRTIDRDLFIRCLPPCDVTSREHSVVASGIEGIAWW